MMGKASVPTSFEEFAARLRAEGYEEVLVRSWPAHEAIAEHRHPFEAKATVIQGEMWLTQGGSTRHLLPGDEFHLLADEPHLERYGAAGSTYWVGRKNVGH